MHLIVDVYGRFSIISSSPKSYASPITVIRILDRGFRSANRLTIGAGTRFIIYFFRLGYFSATFFESLADFCFFMDVGSTIGSLLHDSIFLGKTALRLKKVPAF